MPSKARPVIDRVMDKVTEDGSGCWLFTGSTGTHGYGRIFSGVVLPRAEAGRRALQAHRVTYEYFVADIPSGLQIDHLCRTKACVNPWHLEPVTARENVMRGNATKNGRHMRARTHCPAGHPYDAANTKLTPQGWRYCGLCKTAQQRRHWQGKRTAP